MSFKEHCLLSQIPLSIVITAELLEHVRIEKNVVISMLIMQALNGMIIA